MRYGRLLMAATGVALICGFGMQAAQGMDGAVALAAVRAEPGPPGGPVPAGFRPQSATFVSASDGWVLGTAPCARKPCTSVLRTVDGGRAWQGIPAPMAPLSAFGAGRGVSVLRFADPRDGFAYGPELYVTHDGAAAWHRVRLPGRIGDLAAAGGRVYAAVRGSGGRERIYRSPVRENRWSRVAGLPASAGTGTITLHGSAAWIFLGTHLYATRTGAGWVREHVPCRNGLRAASLAAYDRRQVTLLCTGDAALGSTQKVIYASRDGGARFVRAGRPPRGGDAGDLAQPRPRRLFIATSSGATWIYASGNGGHSWHIALSLTDGGKGWSDFGFTTATQGVAVEGIPADGSHLYMTRNAGRSWFRVGF